MFDRANDTGVGARQGAPGAGWHNLGSLARSPCRAQHQHRAVPARVAAQRARVAAEALRRARVEAVYKKIDSTFRGNVGQELDAILDVFPGPLTVLTPAFPPAGRAVRDGVLWWTVSCPPDGIGRDGHAGQESLPTLGRQALCTILAVPSVVARRPGAQSGFCASGVQRLGDCLADAVTPKDLDAWRTSSSRDFSGCVAQRAGHGAGRGVDLYGAASGNR
jgi:hypothetical protein